MTQSWLHVSNVADLAEGQMKAVKVGDASIALFNVDGEIFATSNICTHALAFLTDGWFDDGMVECPLHAGTFDVKTGKGQGPPISCDLRTFPVRIENDRIEIILS